MNSPFYRDRGMDIQRNPGGNGMDNYGFDMDAPKSPWRYPHLMFRSDSRKSKAVSFKQNPGNLRLFLQIFIIRNIFGFLLGLISFKNSYFSHKIIPELKTVPANLRLGSKLA